MSEQEIIDVPRPTEGWLDVYQETLAELDPTEPTEDELKRDALGADTREKQIALDHSAKVTSERNRMRVIADAKKLYERGEAAKFTKALADTSGTTTRTIHSASYLRSKPAQPDMIDGLVAAQGTLNMASGYRGSMKSFGALSVAGAIGTGMSELWGLPVNVSGPVLVVYRESPANLGKRIAAWEDYYGKQMDNVGFYTGAVDMRDPLDVQEVALMVKKMSAVLVIFDPVARTGGGKEDAEDFGAYRLGIEALRDHTGASIYVNHNTGHAERGRGRGHSTLEDAMDSCVAFVKPDKGGGIMLVDTKARDSAPLDDIRLKFVEAGPVNPRTGKPWSGVPVVQTAIDTREILEDELSMLLSQIDIVGGDGITAGQAAEAMLKPKENIAKVLNPYVEQGVIVRTGRANKTRYARP